MEEPQLSQQYNIPELYEEYTKPKERKRRMRFANNVFKNARFMVSSKTVDEKVRSLKEKEDNV